MSESSAEDPDDEPDGEPPADPEPDPSPEEEELEEAELEPYEGPSPEADPPPEDDRLEEAEIEAVDGDLEPFAEPPSPEGPAEGPRAPSRGSTETLDELAPGAGTGDEEARGRRPPNADELEELLDLQLDEPITPLPSVDLDHVDVLDTSPIREGLTYVRLLFDERANRHLYQVVEPPLEDHQARHLSFLRETLVQTLEPRDPDACGDWQTHLREAVEEAVHRHDLELDPVTRARVDYYLERDFLGYDRIDVVMQDPMVEDVSCDGPGIPVYVFHREHESTRTNVVFEDEDRLDSFVRSLAQRSGRHISIAEPLLDATLPDTSRLQATLSREVTTRGSSFTIRRFRADPLTAPDLVRLGTMNARIAAWLWMAIEAGSPMLVAGGTASGKTTTLSSVTQLIPPARKVVTIEDTREIRLVHENWVAALTRSGGYGDQAEGEIDMYQLLRTALRQRPEYIILGEVRGSEAQTLFQAMATGHATYSTLHAESVRSAVHRLENPPVDVPRMMLQTLDAIVVQGQTRVGGRLVRRILDVTEIVGIDDDTGDVLTNQVYEWDPDADEFRFRGRSHVLQELRRRRNATVDEIERDWERRARVVEWLVEEGLRHVSEVARVVAAYYADPDRLIERIEAGRGDAVPRPEEVVPLGETPPGTEGEPP